MINPVGQAFKRVFDLALIFVSLPFLAALLVPLFVLVWLDGGRPVFHAQKRLGRFGREIRIWKFRSMTPGAEEFLQDYLARDPVLREEWQDNFKLRNDARVTRFGRVLRRTSLDELPQVWNVIRGEMSLVGPRPIVEQELGLYGRAYEIYKQVRPGMTGLWQVSGRNNLPYEERVRLDVQYVTKWSIGWDVVILLRTILAVVRGTGAY